MTGNCHPDLAGWRFKIVRRHPVPPWAEAADSTSLAMEQVGDAGDITADQTLRHSDCSVDELLARIRAGEPAPHVMCKTLHFGFFKSSDNCEHCREELGDQWRSPF